MMQNASFPLGLDAPEHQEQQQFNHQRQ